MTQSVHPIAAFCGRWMCALAIALVGCGDDNGGTGGNPHLPGPSDALDAPRTGDGSGPDAMADAAPTLHCGMTGPEVAPLPSSGMASGGAPIGTSMFMGSCGGGTGAEAIYYVPVNQPLTSITFSTDVPQTTSMPILYVRTTCDDTSTEVGCMASSTTAKAHVTVMNPPMGTNYFVFIDEPSAGQSGIFALTVSGNIADGQPCDPANQAFTCNPRHVCVDRNGAGPHCEVARCGDGMDNDGDGKIDFPHDPGCTAFEDDDESDDCPSGPNCPQCGNGIDDDGDGKIDYDPPAGGMSDPGCSSQNDPSEIDECIPGVMVTEFDSNGHAAGDTTSAANHFAPSSACAFEALAGDQVFHYRVDQPTRAVNVTMTVGSSFFDPIVYIRKNNCGDINSQVGCQLASSGTVATGATNLTVGNDLYFFADGELSGTSSAGPFTMQLDVQLDLNAACTPGVTWKHCGAGLKCQNNVCVKTQCADGIDNDGDSWIDYPMDPGCTSLDDDTENSDTCMQNPNSANCPQCGNGRDDDGDGLIDYPMDPGCQDRADNNEADDCFPASGMPGVMVTDITGMTDVDGQTCPTGATCPGTCTAGTNCGVFTSNTCANFSTGPEKVYLYRLTTAVSSMTATTCTALAGGNTDFDTVLYIRKTSCVNDPMNTMMNEVTCDDDNGSQTPPAGTCGSTESLHSYVHTGPLQPGNYFIFVDGYSTNMGHFHLHVTTTP